MKKILYFLIFMSLILTSCDKPSDIIVKIYGVYEYNCTTDEYRILSDNAMLPFMKMNRWYTREEFHIAHSEYTLKPFKDLPIKESSVVEITPSQDESNNMLNELIMDVDCNNPKDVLL